MKRILTFVFVLIFISSPFVRAGEADPLQTGIFTEDLTVPVDSFDLSQPISLDEVTRLGVARNLQIDISRIRRRSEAKEISIAKSIYDTGLDMDASYGQDHSETSSVVLGNRVIEGAVEVALSKKIPLGTTLKVIGTGERHSTTSAFSALAQNYTSGLAFEVEQPLLRNFFGTVDRKQIKQVRLNVKKFDFETLDLIEGTLKEIRDQYWDLSFAYENLLNLRQGLRKAQDFFSVTRDQVERGLAEKPDRYAAEANVRKRVIEVLEAETRLKTESFALKVLLNWDGPGLLLPAERPVFEPVSIDYAAEMERSVKERRDMKQMDLELEKQHLEVKVRSNERLPELDFTGSVGSTGLDRKLSASQGKPWSFEHRQYFAGVQFSADLENREKRARYDQAKLEIKRLEREKEKLRLRIRQQVDRSLRELELANVRVRQSREIRRLQRKKLEEEERNFSLGRSSSKTIIDFQEDVITADQEAAASIIAYGKALENFYDATDRLLASSGLTEPESALSGPGDHA